MDGELSKYFQANLKGFHWQRIESGLTSGGIPDMNYCSEGTEGWVEFKKTTGWAVGLRPEQIGWHLRRSRAGGRTFIAVRRAPSREDELWLVPGHLAATLAASGLRGLEAYPALRSGPGGPRKWPWEAVREALLGPVPAK